MTATLQRKTRFTDRQRQVIQLIAEGCSNDEIAARLGVTARTAKAHCDALRGKLGVSRRRYIPLAYRAATGEDPLNLGRLACEPGTSGSSR
ncbi:MAG: helix-turn-helix transcriptional regulator [Thermoleophilia bacterium]|nr:helix-turn-helix transcriptional regulator [Thermoleophilia bacterium]